METVNQQEVKQVEGKPAPETKWYVLRVVSGKERKVGRRRKTSGMW